MTQAFNLAQLANNLNTSGQLDATDGLNGLVANANLASSGTPSSTTFLRGDRIWGSLTQKVNQVVQVVKSDTFTATLSTSGEIDITGMSAAITPISASSQILVMVNLNFGFGDSYAGSAIRIKRGSTTIYQGNANGSRTQGTFVGSQGVQAGAYGPMLMTAIFLDSPNTTSSTTYKLVGFDSESFNSLFVNISGNTGDSSAAHVTASSITLMEITA